VLLLLLFLLVQYTLRGTGDAGLFVVGTKVFSVSSKSSCLRYVLAVCAAQHPSCHTPQRQKEQRQKFN
jgi:hypothetical protein